MTLPLQNSPPVLPSAALARAALPALLALLCLTGCGGEPSEGDIEKAVKSEMDQTAKGLRQLNRSASGSDILPKINGIKKIGCTNAQSGAGYMCDVELDVTGAYGGPRKKGVTQFRFVKGSDGWVMTK